MREDIITVMICAPGKRATKQIALNNGKIEISSYDAGYLFSFKTYPVKDIEVLTTILKVLESYPGVFVIRGVPIEGKKEGAEVRRTLDNFQTPSVGHHWIEIDIDKISIPEDLDIARDFETAIEHVVQLLPAEFLKASFYWQLSASAGFTKNKQQISIHLWFWLEEPTSDEKLRKWGKAVNRETGIKLIDTALFNGVQPHFVAKPIIRGVVDPFPIRSGFKAKYSPFVSLDLTLLKDSDSSPTTRPSEYRDWSDESLESGFESKLAAIGDHVGGDGFHRAVIAAAASFVVTEGTGPEQVETCKALLREAILNANRDHHETSYVEKIASDASLNSAINSAIKKFGGCARKKSRLVRGIMPHYNAEFRTLPQAQDQISSAFSDWR